MSFRDEIDRIERDRLEYQGRILVWRKSIGWPIEPEDLGAFCDHMDDWYGIIEMGSLSREQYEKACKDRGIDPIKDENLGGYGSTYGDFGMSHYHTEPKNRRSGIEATLGQQRWYGMKKENPNIVEERKEARRIQLEAERVTALRKTYPDDLQAWVASVGGLEAIYNEMVKTHSNNSTQLREEGRYFEWLIGHACMDVGFRASKGHPGYVKPKSCLEHGVYPLLPEWWAAWSEEDLEHPINKIAVMLVDKKHEFEPYMGKVEYFGYGEDCGDDVRKNAAEWLGI